MLINPPALILSSVRRSSGREGKSGRGRGGGGGGGERGSREGGRENGLYPRLPRICRASPAPALTASGFGPGFPALRRTAKR